MPSKKKQQYDEYDDKRARNNEAVRKSREKARQRAKEIEGKIDKLRKENKKLEEKKALLKKEFSTLKDIFLAHSSSKKRQFETPIPNANFSSYSSIGAVMTSSTPAAEDVDLTTTNLDDIMFVLND